MMLPHVLVVRQIASVAICAVQLYLLVIWLYAGIRTGLPFFWLFVCAGLLYGLLSGVNLALAVAAPQIEKLLGPLFLPFYDFYMAAQPLALAIGAVGHTILVRLALRSQSSAATLPPPI